MAGNTVLYIPMEALQRSPEEASKDKELIQRLESKEGWGALRVCVCVSVCVCVFVCVFICMCVRERDVLCRTVLDLDLRVKAKIEHIWPDKCGFMQKYSKPGKIHLNIP